MAAEQRLAVNVALEALMDAGWSPEEPFTRRIGVFVGVSGSLSCGTSSSGFTPRHIEASAYDSIGRSVSVIAGRISYLLGFSGPSLTVDTACSSALYAINIAKKALDEDECDLAVVIGVSVLSSEASVAFALSGMLAPDGKCHTFDSAAHGYARSDGCCAVVLERQSNLSKRRLSSYAVIEGSQVQSDGKSASLTAPNGLAQQRLLRETLRVAGLVSSDISFLEAHGTGTKLGDPIEIESVTEVYLKNRPAGGNPLSIGSTKAVFGHTEAASGMVGLLGTILVLNNRVVYPNGNLKSLNDQIRKITENLPVVFPVEPFPLATNEKLYGAVSSFGYSGSIAHLIISCSESVGTRRNWNRKIFPDLSLPNLLDVSKKITYFLHENERKSKDECIFKSFGAISASVLWFLPDLLCSSMF
jgi:acyl transferase domain-containing protein